MLTKTAKIRLFGEWGIRPPALGFLPRASGPPPQSQRIHALPISSKAAPWKLSQDCSVSNPHFAGFLKHFGSFYKNRKIRILWGVEDSNLRRLSQQIYSLPHLTALETPRCGNIPANRHISFFQTAALEPSSGIEPETS